jgi:hypothetical protein
MSERRWRLLTACFEASFLDQSRQVIKIDGSITPCPYATLPKDWNVSRRGAPIHGRRSTSPEAGRSVGEYRITVATSETFDRDLKTLLGFWEAVACAKADRIDADPSGGNMLTRSFQAGQVTCRPSGMAIGRSRRWPRSWTRASGDLVYMTGRDETFGDHHGEVCSARLQHSPRDRVRFCRIRLPARQQATNIRSKARSADLLIILIQAAESGRADRYQCIPDVLQQAAGLHRKGPVRRCRDRLRRILEVEPKRARALPAGRLLAAKG